MPDIKPRLWCWYCHKSVSTGLPEDFLFRAIAVCPECIKDSDIAKEHPLMKVKIKGEKFIPRNSMIIKHDSRSSGHFMCVVANCETGDPDETIPTFYSYKDAIDSGWVWTNEAKYRLAHEPFPVWVCKNCYGRD